MNRLSETYRILRRFLVSVYILVFFELGYFWAGRGHSQHLAQDWQTFLDNLIPVIPVFIVFYFLGYLFVFVPSFTVRDSRKFRAAASVFILLMVVSFAVFKLLPVNFDKPQVAGGDFFSRLIVYQHRVDSRFNHFPSLHVSLNVFALLVMANYHGRKVAVLLAPLVVLIVLSTMFVKQHLIVDVAGGVVIGYGAFHLYRLISTKSTAFINSCFFIALAAIAAFGVYQSHKLEKIIVVLGYYFRALFS